MNVNADLTALVRAVYIPASGVFNGKELLTLENLRAVLVNGTTADKCDLLYRKRHSFTPSTAQTIDLTAATGDDGVACNFVEVVAILIVMRTTTAAHRLTIDNAGATSPHTAFLNAAGTLTIFPCTVDADGSSIKNYGFFVLFTPCDPAGAVSGSDKNLRLLPSAHAFTADVYVLGRSA